ncbi:ankyrin repeat domain-containing protein 26-like isoform X23 [Ruditapes philippinarum]|uniref:ankyrin repeat domain-containing protein 26-like isoform X23 n=1 Tax=Ruditapes philippinarum TaxID=129788 RepID=UPI00295B641D|nr:ankyrin repeat domain-containing protein 26-like isoform X23 [Ruditapes philippinarum]
MKKFKGIFKGKTTKGLNTSGSGSIGGASGSHNLNSYDLKEKDLPKIHKAAWTGDISKVRQLAKKDPTALDKENRTPLHLACAQGHADVVEALLEWNARVNVGDNQGKTPLMKAIECNQEKCVKLLLEHKVDINVTDKDKNTALHLAVKEGNTAMVALLVRYGAKVNVKNKDGRTPLILSVQDPSKRDEPTRILLENGADPNLVDNEQRSALHHACIEDGIHHVKLLLQHKASTALKDVKGWTAEDCAMMKAHHACSQVVFDHNIKQRHLLTGSVPSTPRTTDSATPSRHTTPRDNSASDFGMPHLGMPQGHEEDADDSDDQTVSKHSLHDNRQDSWADDTDISSATDDHKLKPVVVGAAVKTSLTKHIKMDSDEDEEGGHDDGEGGVNVKATNGKPVPDPNHRRSPVKFRKVLVSTGDFKRPMYSRTPTPEGDLRKSPASPFTSTPSKIPVKQRLSGASHTSVDEDFSDDDDDDDEDDSSPIQRNRVSFSDHQQVRNISATDDDTDIEDDEEEVEPSKKRRIETPEEASTGSGGYTPTGVGSTEPTKLSKESFKAENGGNAFMAEMGMEDVSDVSDFDDSEVKSPRDSSGPNSQPNTPRGILKKPETVGKPPSNQNLIDTDPYWDSEDDDPLDQDNEIIVEAEVHPATIHASLQSPVEKDEESDWDSTRHSGTDKGSQSIQIREEVESPEVDSDLEDTLNPEKSTIEKDPTVIEDLSTIQDSNTATVEVAQESTTVEIVQESTTLEIVQESTTPDNVSGQDKLADTGEINALFINELNESTDISHQGSRSSSVAMETQRAMTVIEKTETTDNDLKSSFSQDMITKIENVKRSKLAEHDDEDEFDSDDETMDRIEMGTQGTLASDLGTHTLDQLEEKDVGDNDVDQNEESFEKLNVNEEKEVTENQAEIDELISEEIDYYNGSEKSIEEDVAHKESSLKEEIEKSVSEGLEGSRADFKVMDRLSAPKVMLEYEPSTTEAEDSDTLDTESLQEDFVQMVKNKKKKKLSSETKQKISLSRNGSMSSDKEVARALADESPTTLASRLLAQNKDDFNRASTEPITQDTMEEQTSLADDEGDETSQWDSTEEACTPRTPRDTAIFVNQLGEIENESPGPVYDDMIQPEQQQQRFASPDEVKGQVNDVYDKHDEESDEDIEEINDEQVENIPQYEAKEQFGEDQTDKYQSLIDFNSGTGQYNSGQYNSGQYNSGHYNTGSYNSGQFNSGPFNIDELNAKKKVEVEVQSDEDEFEDGVVEEMILPQDMKKEESGITQAAKSTELSVNGDISAGNAEPLLSAPPPLPQTSPPGKAMSLQSDGQSVEDDDLDAHIHTKPPGPSFLPDLSGTTGLYSSGLEVPFDDDGLSVTSTENGDISSSYRPENLPYGKDMLVNMNLNDSSAVLKLQEHLREHRKQLEYERNQKMLLESKQKQMNKDKAEMQKMLDSLKYQKSALEQSKLDLEAKIRNLEYCVSDEEEKKKNAELLLKKTKEQLAKKEEQYTHEMEAKQRAELAMRNVQMELRSAQNQMKDLEEEKVELERQLANEKNARQLQEKINEEQQRLQQHMHEESFKTSSEKDDGRDEANKSLELADDDIKQARDLVEKYKNEITALKAELQRQRTRLTDENNLLSSDNEKLQQRVEDLRNEVKDHEEALTQLTVQQNLHNSKLMSESTMLSNSLDKERIAREKLEAELESIRTRLQSSNVQVEKAQQARNDLERRLHGDREEWARQLDRKDQELASLKEKVQAHIQALNATESKLNAVENELQISNTTLLERTNQYQQVQRDLQFYKTAQENNDSNIKHEKEMNAKYVAKIESLQERLSSIQHENLSLKQQVDTAQHLANDRAGFDLQDKLNTMITTLKADHDKVRASLEEKNTNLQDTITRLREEVRNSENRRSNLEQDIRRLNQEQNDIIRKLSIAEASLDVAAKARDHLEQERLALKMEIEKLQQKYNTAQETTIQAQTKMGELVDRLDRTEQSRLMSNQQLADTSATMHAFNTSKSELEENYQKIQVENVRLDAELKHEKQKTDMLQRDLADSQKVRSSLEALCSNLKSTNAHLEEKLGGEVVSRNLYAKEAEDHKGLWEQEVLSRSKLGLRIAQLERHKQETSSHLEEEKRRTRKALEQKKLAETKLEAEQDKCQNLQKEVANLKAYLKVAKKRLKEPGSDDAQDTNENRMSNLHSAFDKERHAMEEMLVSVKSQLEHMKIQLQDEIEEKERVHSKNQQLENELKTVQKLERSVQKIDRSKRKLETEFKAYKNSVETGYTEKSSVEEAKKEIEARYRQELNRKLDEVNNYLEEQARTRQRLDLSRDEQETKIRNDKKRFEEECIDLRIKYEQAIAKLETKDLEAKRYRDLYESEMQWRMRLSEQLYKSTDKAFGFKNKLVAERQKNRMYGSMTNLSMNGHTLDISKLNGTLAEDALSNRLRAELDRSIAKHLEAAPHDQIRPLIRSDDPVLSSNFAKASADYIEVLKRKYCV